MKKAIILTIILCLGISAFGQNNFYRKTTSMTFKRQMYGAVVLGDHMYVMGGNSPNKKYIKSVQKAKINADGTLGNWEDTTPLPSGRSYIENSTLALNDIVYIVDGMDGIKQKCAQTILWSRPGPDGHLQMWKESLPHPERGLHCSVAVATPGYIHIICGFYINNEVANVVWSAKIGSDGSITGWERGKNFPTPLWYHCGEVAGGKVWVWGGLTTKDVKSVNRNVYCASILPSGKLGEWRIANKTLPHGFYAASCTVSGDYLLSFCPRYAGRIISNDIWYTRVTPDGLTDWSIQRTGLQTKLFSALATDYRRGYIYLPGGRVSYQDKYKIVTDVNYFKLNQSQQNVAGTNSAVTTSGRGEAGGEQSLSYVDSMSNMGGEMSGFVPYEQARSSSANKPMVIYFHSDKATKCSEQKKILEQIDADQFKNKVALTEVNTQRYPQMAQTYGVFRVPCWVFFDVFGKERQRKTGVVQPTELQNLISGIAQ